MPKVIKNGVCYNSTSGDASDIIYDDKETKLGAFTVQDAIGRLKQTIKNLSVLTPKIVDSVDKMTDRTTNYVLKSTKEIYQWSGDAPTPTGIYYKMSDTTATLDFSEFNLRMVYDDQGKVQSIVQNSGETTVSTTFEYDQDTGTLDRITESDTVNTIETTLEYGSKGEITSISRKIIDEDGD